MRFTQNRSEEIRAMVIVIADEVASGKRVAGPNPYKWFYEQVADLVERQEKEEKIK